jgi:surfactin synthase thioesterase subunit
MASPRLRTPRAIDGCSLGQLITFYLSLIHQVIYDMPSTVGEMHGSPSTPHTNDDTRTRSGAEKNMTEIMASLRGVRPPELSRQQLRLVA